MGGVWTSVAENKIMQPVWDDTVCVHQVTNRLQYSLEIVLLWFTSHHYVECFIHILWHATNMCYFPVTYLFDLGKGHYLSNTSNVLVTFAILLKVCIKYDLRMLA